jgi:hypothetical protein
MLIVTREADTTPFSAWNYINIYDNWITFFIFDLSTIFMDVSVTISLCFSLLVLVRTKQENQISSSCFPGFGRKESEKLPEPLFATEVIMKMHKRLSGTDFFEKQQKWSKPESTITFNGFN